MALFWSKMVPRPGFGTRIGSRSRAGRAGRAGPGRAGPGRAGPGRAGPGGPKWVKKGQNRVNLGPKMGSKKGPKKGKKGAFLFDIELFLG